LGEGRPLQSILFYINSHFLFQVVPDWEFDPDFDPLGTSFFKNKIAWINCRGQPLPTPAGYVFPIPMDNISDSNWEELLHSFLLRDPGHFVAGLFHKQKQNWETLTKMASNNESSLVMSWINHGVDAIGYFQHFKGNFKGKALNHNTCHLQKPPVLQRLQDGNFHSAHGKAEEWFLEIVGEGGRNRLSPFSDASSHGPSNEQE
jgi:hypothetical protein